MTPEVVPLQDEVDQPKMFIPKLVYFFTNGANACLLPYFSLYYQNLGLSGQVSGILLSIPPLVAMFAAPAWGALADATQRHKAVLLLTMGASALSVLLIPMVDRTLALALVILIYALFTAPITPLVDNSVLELLGAQRQGEYGLQRVWGSIGWGITGLASGWMVGWFGLPVTFYLYAGLLLAGTLVALRLPVSRAAFTLPFGHHLRQLVAERRWLVFLLVAWAAGAGFAMLSNYYFVYLNDLGARNLSMGVALAIGVLGEIPFMFYSGRLLNRLGPRLMLGIGTAILAARALSYFLIQDVWLGVAVQILHGPSYVFLWVGGVAYAARLARPGMGATAQGAFGGAFTGLGFATGALLGGIFFDAVGIHPTYLLAALGLSAAAGLFLWNNRGKK